VPIKVFPVDPAGHPSFVDDFGYVRPGGQHAHGGIDIHADQGARVFAPDDGALRFAEDPKGGHVFYLTAPDGMTYYGAHLDGYEGTAPRAALAGEIVGYVGMTGNAQGTTPHLHFEAHPGGGAAVDPFGELAALLPSAAKGGHIVIPPSVPYALAAKAFVSAWSALHPSTAPGLNALAWPLAQAIAEGSFTSYFRGTNNVGAMHATSGFAKTHAGHAGYGMVAFTDGGPSGRYITRMIVVPSLAIGASAFLVLVEHDTGGDLNAIADVNDYAARLYVSGYYTGTLSGTTPLSQRAAAYAADAWTPDDRTTIAAYAVLVKTREAEAQAAILAAPTAPGDPSAKSSGAPFAPLAERLTPGPLLAPHTIAHARAVLGPSADTPPAGGISLADALAAPGGDGVWLFDQPQPKPTPPGPVAASSSSSGPFVLAAAVATVAGAIALAARS
jgi:hypothetical protein